MGKGGGSADSSGVAAAMASAQAAELSYQLGEQQLQWAKDVWNQEQPLVNAAEEAQITLAQADTNSLLQMQKEAQDQWNLYVQYYQPLEQQYVAQAENWASPENLTLVSGQAQANVAEQTAAGLGAAQQQLKDYGIDPSAGKYAGLTIGADVMGGAAQAGAGTMATQNQRLQQMALEAGAINTGRGVANSTGQLTGAGTGASQAGGQAAAGSAGTAQQNLATGSSAFTAPAQWFNAGANNMNVYTNAVANYNNTQLGYAELGAQSMLGLGQLGGDILGMLMPMRAEKGGPMGYDRGGIPVPEDGTPGGHIPANMSPSGGQVPDDVHALLTAGEFVMPRDVVQHKGQEFFYNLIDKTRASAGQAAERDDIGGEPAHGIPPMPPRFISRPMHTGAAPSEFPPPEQMQTQPPRMGIPMQAAA